MTDKNLENPEVNSDEMQESLDAARVEAWKAYYALKSGAELEAAEKAYAEEVAAEEEGKFRIPSPDWRTLKPGVRDSALYTETSGYYDEDSDLTWWDGRNVSGVTIGLVQFRANVPMMPGNMGNATTFDFPMLYREMLPYNIVDVLAEEPTANFTEAIVDAARWLELQGVSAIMGNCGFFGSYQNTVQARINTPFFSSSLMQLPMIVQSMPRDKKVAVITANGPRLSIVPAIEACGLSAEDKANRIVVRGLENAPEFVAAVSNTGKYNAARVEAEIIETTKLVMQEHDIGAVLLECTELSPHAVGVQNAVRMPVWDYTTLTKWIYSGTVRRPFVGHI